MNTMTRRKLLQTGAAGTAAAGLAMATGMAPAGAGATKAGGIHIHATLRQTGGPPLPLNGRLIDVTVFGPDNDLSGCGWDADPETAGGSLPKAPDGSQCYFTQRGSLRGDAVVLKGRNLFAMFPPEVGQPITTEANLATGQVTWTDGEGDDAFVFRGTGVVTRI